jgi:protein gp37
MKNQMTQSGIEWTDVTWNPTTGCTICSKECNNCYALELTNKLQKLAKHKFAAGFDVFVEHPYTLKEPYRLKTPRMIFVNSMSDLFHEKCSKGFIQKVFKVMNQTPQHTYQVLTKRHHKLLKLSGNLNWTRNIWMGVSVGSGVGVRRIDFLRRSNAKNKFLSIEPLIEELPHLDLECIDWVIVGGESGKNARPVQLDWILKIQQDCKEQDVPFFFKQWGKVEFNPDPDDPTIWEGPKGGCQIDGEVFLANPCVVEPLIGELPFTWD